MHLLAPIAVAILASHPAGAEEGSAIGEVAARGRPWEIALGVRDAALSEGQLDGARLAARFVRRGWAVEAGVYGSPRPLAMPDLGVSMVQIVSTRPTTDFQYPFEMDLLSADLRLDIGAFSGDTVGTWSGGPHAYLGVEGRWMTRAACISETTPERTTSVEITGSENVLVAGPLAGVGIDGWYRGRVGLRFVVLDRTWWGSALSFEPGELDESDLHHDATAFLDILVAL